jgi:hypothetical protein
MKSYLSLDLDFFLIKFISDDTRSSWGYNLYSFMDRLISLNKPIDMVVSHQELVPFIKKHIYEKIYNVDFHSDICHELLGSETPFNEGTWANFIPYTNLNTEFQWNYPSTELCYDSEQGICDTHPKKWCPNLMPYKKVTRVQGLKKIDYDTVERIGICISPYWSKEEDCETLFNTYPSLFKSVRKKLLKVNWDDQED